MNILRKIQNLPASKKKLIFWSVLIAIGFLLLFFWAKNFSKKIQTLEGPKFLEELKIPEFKDKFKNIPKPPKDDLKKLGEMMKAIDNQQKINNK